MKLTISTILLLLSLSTISLAQGECQSIPKGEKDPTVKYCIEGNTLKIHTPSQVYSYSITQMKTNLIILIENWLYTTPFPKKELCNSKIEFWLSVPEANPEATQARLVLKNQFSNFLSYLSLNQSDWFVSSDTVAILGKKDYPNYFGHMAQSVLVKAKENVSKKQLSKYLSSYDLAEGNLSTGRWYSYKSPIFEELTIRNKIVKDPFSFPFIDGIEVNSAFEWISNRDLVIDFDWQCDI